MSENINKGDIDTALKLLENLEICLSEDDGAFTVASHSEPFFCFTRSTKKELEEVVIDTIQSYLKSFYRAENVRAKAIGEPIESPAIYQRRLKPVSRLRPVFDPSQEG